VVGTADAGYDALARAEVDLAISTSPPPRDTASQLVARFPIWAQVPASHAWAGHDRVGLAPPDEVHGDQDRAVLLLAQREGRVLVHADDLGRRHDRDVGREVRRQVGDHRRVADQQQPVSGVLDRIGEGTRDDLGGTVIPAHRIDGDADTVALIRARQGPRVAHRVSGRRRRRPA